MHQDKLREFRKSRKKYNVFRKLIFIHLCKVLYLFDIALFCPKHLSSVTFLKREYLRKCPILHWNRIWIRENTHHNETDPHKTALMSCLDILVDSFFTINTIIEDFLKENTIKWTDKSTIGYNMLDFKFYIKGLILKYRLR